MQPLMQMKVVNIDLMCIPLSLLLVYILTGVVIQTCAHIYYMLEPTQALPTKVGGLHLITQGQQP